MANNFFYDGQIRRFLLQFIRIMSHFQVEFGADRNGVKALQTVPVMYGDPSRQAAQILAGNTENALPTVPAIACYISGFDYDRARVQEPYHVSKMQIRERQYDAATDTWGHGQGNAFTVERMMPVPYKLTLKVDIWTSNTEQKHQLVEQICPIFNPALEIQSTDNYIDWTSLSAIFLMGTNWTSRTVPAGANTQIDIATLTFELPIWLSLPAKVKKMGVIEKIFASIYDANGDLINDIADLPSSTLLSQRVFTPMDYGIVYLNNTLQLFRPYNIVSQTLDTVNLESGDTYAWKTFVDMYGAILKDGIAQVRLDQPNGSVVVGTVAYHPGDTTKLIFTPINDTIPSNTVLPITAVIDPFNVSVDTTYLNVPAGTRYLILNDIGSLDNLESAQTWHGSDGIDLVAKANDIIEYSGGHWFVSFAAEGQPAVKYVTNLKSGVQLKWLPDQKTWVKSVEGKYLPGDWTIVLTS
jgi:hypothetical protein